MDPPDTTFDRDRWLLDPSPIPPVRLLRPSVPYSGPEQDRSPDATVSIHERGNPAEMSSASPGQVTSQETSGRRFGDDVLRHAGDPFPLQ